MKSHISLNVSDITKTVDFYSKFFKISPTKVKEDYAKFIVEEAGLVISFVQNPSKVQKDFGHLGFVVNTAEALESYLKKMQENNIELLLEGNTVCCYAEQDKFWAIDPDGYRWEVYLFIKDVETEKETNACCPAPKTKEESCCSVSMKTTVSSISGCC